MKRILTALALAGAFLSASAARAQSQQGVIVPRQMVAIGPNGNTYLNTDANGEMLIAGGGTSTPTVYSGYVQPALMYGQNPSGLYVPLETDQYGNLLTTTASGGSMIYPGAGVACSTSTAWCASYTVGATGSDLLQLSSGNLSIAGSGNFGSVGISNTGDAGITLTQTTAATSTVNYNSPLFTLNGQYWNGSASATDTWSCYVNLQIDQSTGVSTNPLSYLECDHSGTSGAASFRVPGTISSGAVNTSNFEIYGSPAAYVFGVNPVNAATSSTNYSSPYQTISGSYYTGSGAANDLWNWQDVLGTGSDPTSTLTLFHSGTPGTSTVSFGSNAVTIPNLTVTNLTVANCSGAGCGSGGGGGGTGNVSTSGTPTAGVIPLWATTSAIGNSALSDNGSTITSSEPISIPGSTGITTPQITLPGSTSGSVVLKAQAAAGTPTITLPVTSGQLTIQTAEVIAYSATPTFTPTSTMSRMVLTGNVTSFTLGSAGSGQLHILCFEQGSGSYTVTPPSNVHGFTAIGTTSGKWNCQSYMYDAADSIWLNTNGQNQ